MSLEWQARSGSLAWSNPVSWWWGLLTLVSGVNIAVWFVLYRELPLQPAGAAGGASGIGMMLLFCAAYVFGCAFRSFLPRADVQRICLFDTWLSSVMVGRSVATVAEIAFVAQWAIILHQLGTMTGAETTVNAAWVIVPLILIAECLSWYAVLTTKLSRQRHREFAVGGRLLRRRRRPLPPAAGIPWRGSRGAGHRHRRHRRLSGVSDDDRRPDVPEPLADRRCRWRQAPDARSRACATSARAGW